MHILIAEDNESHAELLILALDDTNSCTHAHVSNGEDVLSYVRAEGAFKDARLPDLILLDLKMPRLDGHEVLKLLKEDKELRSIPVIVLTTSLAASDRDLAYKRHANSYVQKPTRAGELARMLGDLQQFWGEWNLGCSSITPG